MTASNSDVAKVFDEIADLLEIQNENTFRIRAYRNAARLIEGLGASVAEMLAKHEDLTELPGIGKDLAHKIGEIVDSGTCAALEEQRRRLPPTITALLRIPGLGPKRVQALYRSLDISTPEQLYAAVQKGKVRELPGFGEKTETTIRQALAEQVSCDQRLPLAAAAKYAEPLRAYLAATPGVGQAVIAGSYRRARETVGDLDIVVTAKASAAAMERFCDYPEVVQVKSKGETRATVMLQGGLQVDLRVVPQASFGAALYYFTGSKTHNVAVRRIAQQQGLKINEYGVFRGKRRVAGETELSVFKAVGLPYIEPELRENRGEIEAAQASKLPRLLAAADLRGDFSVQAPYEETPLSAWVKSARARQLEYCVLAQHADGVTPERFEAWTAAVDDANRVVREFVLLTALAVDIAEDGHLMVPAGIDLDRVDLVIAGINQASVLPRAKQTRRLLRAMEHPRFTVLAHPAGRRINRPPMYDVDVVQVIRAARERKCLLELDARADRLDLPDVYCRLAKEEGVPIAIASHARDAAQFDTLAHGVAHARRGWLEVNDVANTRSIAALRALLRAACG